MEKGKENINYSAEDIRKYLDGQLSAREMQALEKAALEDPFLADAIEGFQESLKHTVSFETNLNTLNKRLRDRINPGNKKTRIILLMSNWKIAASFLIIIGSAVYTLTYINNKSGHNSIAIGTNKDSGLEKQKQLIENRISDTLNAAKISSSPELMMKDSSVIAYQPVVLEKKSRAKKVNINRKPVESLLQGSVAGVQIIKSKGFAGNYIQGIVIGDSNKAIPLATLKLSGSNVGVLTDANGYFKIYLKNEKPAKEVVINSVGYEPLLSKLVFDSSYIHTFQLKTSATSLNEVVVTGFGNSNESDITEFSKSERKQIAEPIGLDSFYNYINTNKKITTADSLLNGKEVISFIIYKNGELSSFKVLESISPAHDAEIIRLIKSGPPLKIRKGKKQVCQISITF
jgi:hypothetical protein